MERQDEKELANLIREAEGVATELADGHLSIMKFSRDYKVVAGTPCLMPLWPDSEYLWQLPGHETLEEALQDFLKHRYVFPANDGCY
jgi:hypothetical protein